MNGFILLWLYFFMTYVTPDIQLCGDSGVQIVVFT
jgi:hypothetical protein